MLCQLSYSPIWLILKLLSVLAVPLRLWSCPIHAPFEPEPDPLVDFEIVVVVDLRDVEGRMSHPPHQLERGNAQISTAGREPMPQPMHLRSSASAYGRTVAPARGTGDLSSGRGVPLGWLVRSLFCRILLHSWELGARVGGRRDGTPLDRRDQFAGGVGGFSSYPKPGRLGGPGRPASPGPTGRSSA